MKKFLGLLVIICILILLEILTTLGKANVVILPKPSTIFGVFSDQEFLKLASKEAQKTISRTLIGFGLAASTAIPLGVLVGSVRFLEDAFTPLIEILRPIPSSALIPISILFLGLGSGMILFVVWFGSFWPILLNSIYGARSVSRRHKDITHILNLRPLKTFIYVTFPTAIPHIFAGLRVSISIALILAVTAEMLAGQDGLGFFILDFERAFRYSRMYAVIVILSLIGLCLNTALLSFQNKFMSRFPTL